MKKFLLISLALLIQGIGFSQQNTEWGFLARNLAIGSGQSQHLDLSCTRNRIRKRNINRWARFKTFTKIATGCF